MEEMSVNHLLCIFFNVIMSEQCFLKTFCFINGVSLYENKICIDLSKFDF